MRKLILVIVGIAILGFLWWTISPLFINNEVQDELDPEILAAIEALENEPVVAADTVEPEPAEEAVANDSSGTSPELPTPETQPESAPAETSGPAPGTTPGPVMRGPFTIEDTLGHPASGQVRVIETADSTIVRFEDYNGTNGPDLRIYLATDLNATEFVDLGKPRGNMGNINYVIPDDVDLDDYMYVMTWCRAFGVLFDYAEIN